MNYSPAAVSIRAVSSIFNADYPKLNQERKRWWETVPAIVGAIAALLAAIASLIGTYKSGDSHSSGGLPASISSTNDNKEPSDECSQPNPPVTCSEN